MKNFDSIEDALNVDTEVVEDNKIEPRKNQLKKVIKMILKKIMNTVVQIYILLLKRDRRQLMVY